MQLTALGTGNAFNENGLRNSSYLIESNENLLLVDCGFTSVIAVQQLGINLDAVNNVLITHFHGDHTGGLPAFFLAKKYLQKTASKINIYGPKGIAKHCFQIQKALYEGTEKLFNVLDIEFHEVAPGEHFNAIGLKIQGFKMNHSQESLGYLIDKKSKLGITGDSAECDGLSELISLSRTVIGECSNERVSSRVKHLGLDFYLKQDPKKQFLLVHYNKSVIDKTADFPKNIRLLKEGETLNF